MHVQRRSSRKPIIVHLNEKCQLVTYIRTEIANEKREMDSPVCQQAVQSSLEDPRGIWRYGLSRSIGGGQMD